MKNILLITDFNLSGGAATFVRAFIQELSKNNQISAIFFYDQGNNPDFKDNIHINYISIPLGDNNSIRFKLIPKRIFLLYKHLSRLKNNKFDIIYTDLDFPTLSFQFARLLIPKLRHVPIYHHIHGSFSRELKSQQISQNTIGLYQKIKQHIYYLLEHFVLKHSQIISVNSHYSQLLTQNIHGNLPIIINKPGIDYSLSAKIRKMDKSTARKKLGLNPNGKYLLFTSRIEPRKGVCAFFENIVEHSRLFISTNFIVCCHFAESSHLNEFLDKLDRSKLGARVLLINSPSRHQLSLLYRAANITILPSTSLETFGLTTLESYYFGTPVVAFNIGANSELIPASHLVRYPTKNCWTILYKKICGLLNNSDSNSFLQHNYSWKNFIKTFLSST